jgi:uncharacterized Zn finger protein
LLVEQIVKMDCDRCKLKTEHYILDYGDVPMLCRCMRCGQVKKNPGLRPENKAPYPIEDRRPVYVA